MPIITLGTTEPESIIVETGTLPDDFYSSLQASDVEMQEPVDYDTKDSLIVNYMNNVNSDTVPSNKANTKIKISNKHVIKEEPKKNWPIGEVSSEEALKEFSARGDGSVNCNLCGKIFASRQHWYRHKYRAHVVDPVPLNKCEKCLIFFKSRKGYLGHMSSKHSETIHDFTPMFSNEQGTSALAKALAETVVVKPSISIQPKQKVPDPEIAVPKTIAQNCQSQPTTSASNPSRNTSRTRSLDKKKANQCAAKAPEETELKEYQERRVKDESFVMGIIEKVRRQCATEPEGANRRGYSRKPYSVRT